MKKAVNGIEFERFEDDYLYRECVDQLNISEVTKKERDFKLALRISEEIRCKNLRKEALKLIADSLVRVGEISWAIETAKRTDSSKKSLIFAHICRKTGDVSYFKKAEMEAQKISSPRLKEFVSREILNIIAN